MMVMMVVMILWRVAVACGGGGRLRGGRGRGLSAVPPPQPRRDGLGGDHDSQVLRRRRRAGAGGARVSAVRLHVGLEGRPGRGELPHPQAGRRHGGRRGGDGVEVHDGGGGRRRCAGHGDRCRRRAARYHLLDTNVIVVHGAVVGLLRQVHFHDRASGLIEDQIEFDGVIDTHSDRFLAISSGSRLCRKFF